MSDRNNADVMKKVFRRTSRYNVASDVYKFHQMFTG